VHKPLDPRAERILELADERGVSGRHVALARAFRDAAAEAWGRPLTMNVSMPIAAVMLDLGFGVATVKAVPILARTASLLAHLAEEREQPLGFLMAGAAEDAIRYEEPGPTPRPTRRSSPTCSSARRSTARSSRAATPTVGWPRSRGCR
jgi:citrate synthase